MMNFKSLQKPLVLLFLLCLLPMGAWAQGVVKGIVNDEAGEPIIGATVKVVGTNTGAITDMDGKFSLNAASNAQLSVSYVGYVTQRVNVAGKSNLVITMKEDAQSLSDVVVIGYGVQKKSDLSGSVASLKGEEIENLSTTDAAAAMQGKISGVQIINTSGDPTAGASIRVRGYSSNSGNLGPLIIVDGLKVDGIQYLDPSLIESMEVLKDGASAAIYGAQAGNGVVLITTKNGKKGSAHVTYSFKAASQTLSKKAELFNAKDWIEYHKYLGDLTEAELIQKGYYGQTTEIDGKTVGVAGTERYDTNWYDEVFDKGWNLQHNITVEGGNDKGHFLAGLGIVNNDGMVRGDKDVYKRFTGQINADYKFFDWLSIQSNTSIEKYKMKSLGRGYGSFLNAVVSIDPLTPAYIYDTEDFGDGVAEQWNNGLNTGHVPLPAGYTAENPIWYGTSKYNVEATGNPLARRDLTDSYSEGVNVRGALAANFMPIKSLTITSRLGYRIAQGNGHSYGEPFYLSSMAKSDNYSISANTNASLYYQWENFANWNKQFGLHNVGAMVGMSFTKSHSDNTSVSSSDTQMILRGDHAPNFRYISSLNDNGKAHLTVGNTPNDATELAYFGRLSYSFADRYFFQANFRADAFDSSKLSKEQRWGYFPSFSAAWTVSNEPFFKNAVSSDAVSFLKLRASWGRNGNVNVLNGYKYNASIALGGYYVFTDQYNPGDYASEGGQPNGVSNPSLTWETSEQIDLGLDARFLNNRLSLGIDWYRKMTKDLLIDIHPYPELGFSTQTVNSGEILNTGFDIDLGWRDQIGDLHYSIAANFNPLKNEVKAVNSLLPRYTQGGVSGFNNKLKSTFETGHTIWFFRGFKYAGVYNENLYAGDAFDATKVGQALYYDKDGNLTLAPDETNDMMDLGCGIPKFTYGITLNLEYKGFDFTVFGTGASGNKIYTVITSADRPRGNGLDVWWKDSSKKDENGNWTFGKYPDMKAVAGDWTFFSSDANVFSGAFFKFKQIQLGYTVPAKLTKKFMVNALRFSVSLDDFFTITSYPGADPETASVDGGASRGWDNGSYPTSKKVVFGVNVTF
ncbi:MAG: TonB-dependent receptor [Prevotella sp.]|nr:TonB-dependent receptor [Prevotella sp.]